MVPARIPHKTECDHAQTPYARRKCRAARVAAITQEETPMQPRYTVTSMIVAGRPMYYVYDGGQTEVYRTRERAMAEGRAETLNRQPAEPTAPAAQPVAEQPKPATGWSKAAKRRAGRPTGGHPLGERIARGQGYSVYRDSLTGRGEVQIWDES